MSNEVVKARQKAMIGQYETLYNDYVVELNSAQLQKARQSQRALKTVEKDIYENTLSMPPSENSGYLELKSKMERVPTAEAQEDHTKAQMDASKLQYYALLMVAGLTIIAAVRLLVFSVTPSAREVGIVFIVLGVVMWIFR
jgi:hypothetical protein